MTSTGGRAERAAHVAQHPALEKAARVGQAFSGLVHILIGYVVIRVAFGSGGNADQSGALGTVAQAPGGRIVLWVAVVALIALGLWRLTQAAVGKRTESGDPDVTDRIKSVATAIVYFALAYTSITFAQGGSKSSGQQNAGVTAKLMESTGGKIVLVVAGIVIVAVGAYHVYKGVVAKFLEDLTNPPSSITPIGRVGYIAKGLAIAGAGVLVVVATFTSDPSKSTGIDGAVKTLGSAPFGQILLVLAGLGIAAYGIYNIVAARYLDM